MAKKNNELATENRASKAITKHVRVSSYKANKVAQEIRGKSATFAISLLAHMPQKSARLLLKTLKSAVANANDLHKLTADELYVKSVAVDRAKSYRRYKMRARGRINMVHRPVSHLSVCVEERLG